MTKSANTARYGTRNAKAHATSERRKRRPGGCSPAFDPRTRVSLALLTLALPLVSALDPTHGEARGHAAAEHVVDRDRRNRVHDRGRHHVVPRRLVAVEELRQGHRYAHAVLRGQQQELIEVLVPGQQQGVGADRDQRRRHQRQVDLPVYLEGRGAVDPCRLVELDRYADAVLLED